MDKNKKIELRHGTEDTMDSSEDKGIITALFDGCLQLLKVLLPITIKNGSSEFDEKTLESDIATLFFWSEEFGVSSGDLDKALQRSEEIRDLTLSVLISLGEFISDGKTLPLN